MCSYAVVSLWRALCTRLAALWMPPSSAVSYSGGHGGNGVRRRSSHCGGGGVCVPP